MSRARKTAPPKIDSYMIAAGDAGRAAVLCAARAAQLTQWVATSSDHGANFTAEPGRIPAPAELFTGDPATVLVAAGNRAARSGDGGQTWQAIPYRMTGVSFVGFESNQVGRLVADHGTEIWTTRDGGKSWTKVRFH